MNRTLSRRLFFGLLLALFASLPVSTEFAQKTELTKQPNDQARAVRLGFLVVVGDSLSAGFQSGSLFDRQQRNGYAALVARQAERR